MRTKCLHKKKNDNILQIFTSALGQLQIYQNQMPSQILENKDFVYNVFSFKKGQFNIRPVFTD